MEYGVKIRNEIRVDILHQMKKVLDLVLHSMSGRSKKIGDT